MNSTTAAGREKKGFAHHARNFSKRLATSAPSLSVKEQTFFIKRLSFLVKANVPLLESLYMVSEQVTSRRHARVLSSVIEDVSNGQSLSRSFGKFPHIFGDFGINIIKVGETSGTLSQNLDYLADELRKRHILQRKIFGAFIYPAVITVATLAITAFLMLYLFPKIMPIFASLHAELPLTTKVVMAISVFLQHWGLVVLAVIAVAVTALVVSIKRSRTLHYWYDGMLLRIPVIGGVVKIFNLATITRTLGLLLKSGLLLSDAIPLAADTTKNLVYKAELHALATTVTRGEKVSEHLRKRKRLFPSVMGQMVAVGERSGNLSNTLIYLSELYEGEVDDFTKNLSSLIEPALMIIMGVLVGFIAISIITPIYGITQHLQPH